MTADADHAGAPVQLVTFFVGNDHFGLPISDIRDVFTFQNLTRVPLAPHAVAGLFNLRGRIITMMSMRALLGHDFADVDAATRAIGIDRDGDGYGLIVDRMGEVMSTDVAQREPVPANLVRMWGDLASAVHRQPDGLLIELNTAALLSIPLKAAA
jgi:purine-binding chemotaxis protein CheW